MVQVSARGKEFLRQRSKDISTNSLPETILAAIADKGPIDEEELDGWFSKVGGAEESVEWLRNKQLVL